MAKTRDETINSIRSERKSKRKWIYLIIALILFLGCLFILNKQITNIWLNVSYKPQQNRTLSVNDLEKNQRKARNAMVKRVDSKSDKAVDESVTLKDILNSGKYYKDVKDNIIGSLYLPTAADVSLPVLLGGSNQEIQRKNMLVGASTPLSNMIIGKSTNIVIGAHNMLSHGIMFSNLTDMDYGDYIYLTNGKYIYVYEVYSKFEVDPDQVEIYDQNQHNKRDIVTLYTCNTDGSKREIIRGELEYKIKNSKASPKLMKHFNFSKSKKISL